MRAGHRTPGRAAPALRRYRTRACSADTARNAVVVPVAQAEGVIGHHAVLREQLSPVRRPLQIHVSPTGLTDRRRRGKDQVAVGGDGRDERLGALGRQVLRDLDGDDQVEPSAEVERLGQVGDHKSGPVDREVLDHVVGIDAHEVIDAGGLELGEPATDPQPTSRTLLGANRSTSIGTRTRADAELPAGPASCGRSTIGETLVNRSGANDRPSSGARCLGRGVGGHGPDAGAGRHGPRRDTGGGGSRTRSSPAPLPLSDEVNAAVARTEGCAGRTTAPPARRPGVGSRESG